MYEPSICRFPFGRAVAECGPQITAPRRWLILGAYPSALHVAWTPPRGYKPVQALAVDNEPEVFWDGSDEPERIDAWQAAVAFRPERGRIAIAPRLNGSSGQWLDQHPSRRFDAIIRSR
jgi:hypothetical protein